MKETKKVLKRLMAALVSAALLMCIIPAPFKAEAATYRWVLTSQRASVCKGYNKKTGVYSNDQIYGNGKTALTSGRTYSSGNTHTCVNRYLGKYKGSVRFLDQGGYIYDPKKASTSDNYAECTIPASYYSAGATVKLKVHVWTENVAGLGESSGAQVSVGASGAGYTGSKGTNFEFGDGKTVISQHGNTTVRWVQCVKGNKTFTLKGKMKSDPSVGEKCTIYFTTDAGQYEWNYTYKKLAAPAKAKISSATNSSSKAVTVKYGKVKNAGGYQIQYSTSSKFKNPKTKSVTKTSAKITKLSKYKTYYFRVRAYRKYGSIKVYGAWSKAKSVKIRK